MKKIFTLLLVLLIAKNNWAQAPQKISYQAVIRDGSNELVINQTVGMQISILQGSVFGSEVYVEIQEPISNSNGLVSLEIGNGTSVLGAFNSINWSTGSYFIKTETDPNGTDNYTIIGINQLMSVPYAFHAHTADSVIGGAIQIIAGDNVSVTGAGTEFDPFVVNCIVKEVPHYIGELFGGGIIFYLYDNGKQGLIASLNDLDNRDGAAWGANNVSINALNMTDGKVNSTAILKESATLGCAASLCDNFTGGGFSDWYLPSIRELALLAYQDILINQILNNDGDSGTSGFAEENIAPTYGRYWSSTEFSITRSSYYNFTISSSSTKEKDKHYSVRAIRSF